MKRQINLEKDILGELIGDLYGINKYFAPKLPKTLYHYTTPTGLLGILESKSLWATHTSHLNDSEEMEYAKKLIYSAIDISEKNDLLKTFVDFIPELRKVFTYFDKFFNYYITCFCENGDLLSQWRAYANSGVGYSIGFIAKSLNSDDNMSQNKVMLRKVIYDPKKQLPLIHTILKNGCEGYLRVKDSGVGKDTLLGFIIHIVTYLIECSFCFKHPSFAEENEWRIVIRTESNDTNDLQFRPSLKGLVPYLKLSSEQLTKKPDSGFPIAEIVHGPSLHPEITRDCLKKLVGKTGFNSLAIKGSNAPLRV